MNRIIFLVAALLISACSSAAQSGGLTAPQDFRVVDVQERTIALSWTDSSTDETGFSLQQRISNGGWVEILQIVRSCPSGETCPNLGSSVGDVYEHLADGLNTGTEYCFRIRAHNVTTDEHSSWVQKCDTTQGPPEDAVATWLRLRIMLGATMPREDCEGEIEWKLEPLNLTGAAGTTTAVEIASEYKVSPELDTADTENTWACFVDENVTGLRAGTWEASAKTEGWVASCEREMVGIGFHPIKFTLGDSGCD